MRRLVAIALLTLALPSQAGAADLDCRPAPTPSHAAAGVPDRPPTQVRLREHDCISPGWSRVIVLGVLPAGFGLLVVIFARSAWRNEKRRRRIASPPPGYVLVEGTICDCGPEPAVEVRFQLRSQNQDGETHYSEIAHTLRVRPFGVRAADGGIVRVEPDDRTILLHAPVCGTGLSRSSSVAAGEWVWVHGRMVTGGPPSPAAPPMNLYRTPQHGTHLGGSGELLVSAAPMEAVFRRDRNRRLVVAAGLLAFFIIVHLALFARYLDLAILGSPATGIVTELTSWIDTFQGRCLTGRKATGIRVAAGGRTEDLQIQDEDGADLEVGSRVVVALTSRSIGPLSPSTPLMRCAFGLLLLPFAAFWAFFVSMIVNRGRTSVWYSKQRGWRPDDR